MDHQDHASDGYSTGRALPYWAQTAMTAPNAQNEQLYSAMDGYTPGSMNQSTTPATSDYYQTPDAARGLYKNAAMAQQNSNNFRVPSNANHQQMAGYAGTQSPSWSPQNRLMPPTNPNHSYAPDQRFYPSYQPYYQNIDSHLTHHPTSPQHDHSYASQDFAPYEQPNGAMGRQTHDLFDSSTAMLGLEKALQTNEFIASRHRPTLSVTAGPAQAGASAFAVSEVGEHDDGAQAHMKRYAAGSCAHSRKAPADYAFMDMGPASFADATYTRPKGKKRKSQLVSDRLAPVSPDAARMVEPASTATAALLPINHTATDELASRSPENAAATRAVAPVLPATHASAAPDASSIKDAATVMELFADVNFQLKFASAEEARSHASRRFPLSGLDGDDVAQVKQNQKSYVLKLMKAIAHSAYAGHEGQHRYKGVPLTDDEKKEWCRWQKESARVMDHVMEKFDKEPLTKLIEAKAWLIFEEIIKVHEEGYGPHKKVDTTSICSVRFKRAIRCFESFTRAREDVLGHFDVQSFAADPEEYGRAKARECWGNLTKHEKTTKGGNPVGEKHRVITAGSSIYAKFYHKDELLAMKKAERASAKGKAANSVVSRVQGAGDDDHDVRPVRPISNKRGGKRNAAAAGLTNASASKRPARQARASRSNIANSTPFRATQSSNGMSDEAAAPTAPADEVVRGAGEGDRVTAVVDAETTQPGADDKQESSSSPVPNNEANDANALDTAESPHCNSEGADEERAEGHGIGEAVHDNHDQEAVDSVNGTPGWEEDFTVENFLQVMDGTDVNGVDPNAWDSQFGDAMWYYQLE